MKANHSLADINIYRILRLVWENKGISRIEIASRLGLDKSTITKHISALKAQGLVREIAQGTPGPLGGRKPIFLEITPDYGVVGGIEINSERFICCILDLHGTILFQHQEQFRLEIYNQLKPKGIFVRAYRLIQEKCDSLGLRLLGIGVGLPALINPVLGKIIQSVPLCIEEPYFFVDDLKDITDVPLYIENDARCCCYSERLISDVSLKNVLFVLLEYRLTEAREDAKKNLSIGMGLILNGQIFRGNESVAGEFRSLFWDSAVRGQLKASYDIINSSDGTENAADMELSKHIAFLVNILNLNAVYLGGIDQKTEQRLASCILEQINFLWPYERKKDVDIQTASLGSLSVAYGAASMYLEKIFSIPSLSDIKNSNSFEILTNLK
jgi:predicted NBD/HSP70 family sugar kinase